MDGGMPQKQAQVLIVEDSEMLGYLLQAVLERAGFRVRLILDGRAALQAIEQEAPPRVLLLDLVLPYVDGFQLLERIRAQPEWQTVPVLVITSKAKAADRARAQALGVTDYFIKPISLEDIVAHVRARLSATENA